MAAVLVAAAGCGATSTGSSGSSGTHRSAGAPAPVTVHRGDGGTVLVDRKGNTLYSPDQERNGKIACDAGCVAIWPPAKAPAAVPHTISGASGRLGVLTRPDGSRQLTYDGRPLYTFTLDHGPGHTTGDGTTDSFSGTRFTWHAIRPAGAAAPSPSTSSPSGGGNPYGY